MLSLFFYSSFSRIKTVNRRSLVIVGEFSPIPLELSRLILLLSSDKEDVQFVRV